MPASPPSTKPSLVGYEDQAGLYAYVGNDPINAIDPTGMSCEGTGGKRGVEEEGLDTYCDPDNPDADGPTIAVKGDRSHLKPKTVLNDITLNGAFELPRRKKPQNGLLDELKGLVCALPTLGIGGGADVYAGLGGSVGGSYNFDLANGRFGGSAYVGVGVGVGANVGVQGTGAPSGGGTISANVGVSGGFAAPVAPGLNVGASGTYNVIGTDPGFSGGALGRAGTPSVYGNLQANGGFMTPSLYDLGC